MVFSSEEYAEWVPLQWMNCPDLLKKWDKRKQTAKLQVRPECRRSLALLGKRASAEHKAKSGETDDEDGFISAFQEQASNNEEESRPSQQTPRKSVQKSAITNNEKLSAKPKAQPEVRRKSYVSSTPASNSKKNAKASTQQSATPVSIKRPALDKPSPPNHSKKSKLSSQTRKNEDLTKERKVFLLFCFEYEVHQFGS
jgi:hypothetical protein